jgi:hypothetical protein
MTHTEILQEIQNNAGNPERVYELTKAALAQPAPVPLTDEHIELVAKWLETQAVTTPTNGPILANALRYVGAYVITKGQP